MKGCINRIKNEPLLLGILFASLVINFTFLIWGADYALSGSKYASGDTPGWVYSFLNLLHTGNYTFDLHNKEAYFGRVPGFAFFWGIHYLLFGSHYVYQAVAVSHAIIGVVCTYLVYSISLKIFAEKKAALLAAFLYTCYPFIIYWLTISYAETLSVFINLLFFNVLLKTDKTKRHYFFLGLLAALAFYTREFMGLVLMIAVVYIFIEDSGASFKKRRQYVLFVGIGFTVLYALWPLRNFINHDRFILGRSYNGFNFYNEHLLSYTDWVHCWDNDDDEWVRRAITTDPIVFPKGIFASEEEEKTAVALVKKANLCGTSFLYWQRTYKKINPVFPKENCNAEIEEGFEKLRYSFMLHHPVRYLFDVPIQNIKKALFKNQLKEGSIIRNNTSFMAQALFVYRTVLILLAIAGGVLVWQNRKVWPVCLLFISVYIYICFIYRYVEMRNFVQVDTLMLVLSAYTLFYFYKETAALYGRVFKKSIG